jgi:alpha-amylase
MDRKNRLGLPWIAASLLLFAANRAAGAFPSPDDWREINLYQIFTDRFCDGDPSNNNAEASAAPYNPTDSRGIHGGDFKGIEKKLDYLQSLGITAIWISPIVLNVGGSAYHGYGAHNFYQLAPHWGSMADLTNMVAAAHARGIYVIVDIVCNHQGTRIDSTDSGYPTFKSAGYNLRWTTGVQYPAPFNLLTNFHNNGQIQNYVDPDQVKGELAGLDDLRTETDYVRTNMVEIYKYWIGVADVDGFRIDTVKHVEIGFWQHFNPAIRAYAASIGKTNFFQFGEIYDGAESKCGYYTGTQAGGAFCNDATVDFPLYYKANSVFAKAAGNTKQIRDHYATVATTFDPAAQPRLVTFLDNHDVTRFLNSANANNDTNRLRVGLAFLYSSLGVPCLYYGTEQAFNGGTDPNNREDMFAGRFEQGPSRGDNFNLTHGLFQHVARLNNFRRLYPSLQRGTQVNLWNNPSGPGLFAYARRLGTEEVVVILNTGSGAQTLTNRPTSYPSGTVLVNLFDTNETWVVTDHADGIPPISMPGTSFKMFISTSLWKPLDPVVTGQTPAHGATNVSPAAAVILNFSAPMDTGSVQNAVSVQPATAGTFAWSDSRTTLTFTPQPPGFPAGTTNFLRLDTNAADSVAGYTLHAPFETYFVTATSSFSDAVAPVCILAQPLPDTRISGELVISGTAYDNLAVVRTEFRLDENEWVAATGTTNWSYRLDSTRFLNGTHRLHARAFDAAGNESAPTWIAVRFFNTPGDYARRISAGNPGPVTNCDDTVWAADRAYALGDCGYSGGTNGHLGNAISGICAAAQPLYQYERYSTPSSSFRYLFDCPPGIYEITLLEAETWTNAPNRRLFDAYIEGQQVLTNCDIYAAAGGKNLPLTLAFTGTVADAQLEILFYPQIDNARVSGIQVQKIGEVDSDADGIPDWWIRAYFDHDTGQEADESRAIDDPDADGMDNRSEFEALTDPASPDSVFRIESIAGDENPTLWFPAVSGRLYAVEGTWDLLATDEWVNLQSGLPGTNGPAIFTDTNQFGLRYYRLRVSQP